ncbi:hypothetical protein RSSM_06653 [Rhodopirellula sallentina SM41]|uniref:Uncharacterized protein n=1 Tax=Rhodopirellula sallentina SM41 TaxID=1263870 RepID=M5U241_9BACT|nr:hypothetical protein RSSM_06653 [Rhodopirellula sallentina SM41]
MATADIMSPGNMATERNGKNVVIDCCIKNIYYGNFHAVRDAHIPRGTG